MHLLLRPRGIAARVAGLTGWRRNVMAMGLGLLATLALPPVHLLPLLLLAFPGLVWLIDGAREDRGAFAAGWWWGFGHFSAGFYWISYALLTDPLKFGWMIPFAIFGLGAVVAVFTGLSAYAARRLAPPGVARILALAVAWTFFEWCRSWVLTGFPWNLIGSVWMPVLPVVQLAAVVGTYGLGLLTVVVAAMPAVLAQYPRRCDIAAVVASFGLLLAVFAWGSFRIPEGPVPTVPGVQLRLVQGNIDQGGKWDPALRLAHLKEHIRLSLLPSKGPLTAVVWPETAASFFIDQDFGGRRLISEAVPPGGLLITGAPRGTPPEVRPFQLWNSLQAVDGRANVVATFDKFHLVPFGEYIPYKWILPIPKLTAGSTDFSPGPGPGTLTLPGLPPAGVIICYEAIFPAEVVDRDHRPDWIINITNDGWFGISAGPYQHFAAARLRAVEEGLPLARAANTGITAMIDPYGRVTGELSLGEQGVLDAALPRPVAEPYPYARFGNAIVCLLLLLTGILAAGWSRLFG